MAIAVDDHTTIKLTGALGAFGQDTVITLDEVLSGAADSAAGALWERRARVREPRMRLGRERRPAWDAWWDLLIERLKGR